MPSPPPAAAPSSSLASALAPFHTCVAAFRAGTDTPRSYLERCLARIAECEPEVRAFVYTDPETARREADDATLRYQRGMPLSPIDGMPVGVKDIIDTRDMPTQMNSPIFNGFRPRRDAACVVALKRAGAIIVGKTVTTEFACGRAGATRNPHDLGRTPGGSSSGSAAAVAAGMLPAALGTQTQASIIRPASYCGVYGYKPTLDTLCYEGIGRLAPTLDHLGVIAGDLEDARAVAVAIAAIGPDFHGTRLALDLPLPAGRAVRHLARLDTAGWGELDYGSQQAFENALVSLQQSGVEILDRRDQRIAALEQQLASASDICLAIFAWEAQWPLRAYAECGDDALGPRVKELIALAQQMNQRDYVQAVAWRDALRKDVAALDGVCEGFLSLASSGPAGHLLESTGSRAFPVPWTLVGAPSVSLPVLQSGGLPLGLQLMGFAGADAQTMACAQWLVMQLGESAKGRVHS